ncbi:hypothetical protein [Cupriavidus sp. a3]|uniref:hypothetical protein n=1 Tax=Cupriavidus sp. a3 TaxID=3242158 RepID=UPI003D9C5CD3
MAATALVVSCGVAVLIGMQGAWHSLMRAQERYYTAHRFADVFASVKRAPLLVADQIRALPGEASRRALLSMTGIALAVGLMIVGRFGLDGVGEILALQFGRVQHDDVALVFADTQPDSAVFDMAAFPGVLRAEGFRVAPVWLRHGHRTKRAEVTGLDAGSELREVVGYTSGRREIRTDGVVISARLASLLQLQVGDHVEVAFLEGRRASQ